MIWVMCKKQEREILEAGGEGEIMLAGCGRRRGGFEETEAGSGLPATGGGVPTNTNTNHHPLLRLQVVSR